VESKTDDGEKNGQNKEAANLDRFTTDGVNSCNCDPVTRNETGAGENEIADTVIV
jgi:hypothetical protein